VLKSANAMQEMAVDGAMRDGSKDQFGSSVPMGE
jgi:hypothetical protein